MRPLVGAFLLVLVGLSGSMTASADGPIVAEITSVENKFPEEVVFTAEAESMVGEVRSLVLHLTVGSGGLESLRNFTFTPSNRVHGQFSFKTGASNFIPGGADFTYWLEVEDAAGNKLESSKQTFWYADTRFEWRKLQEGPVTVYYYEDAVQMARTVLLAARETQNKIGRMLGAEARPFKVMLYTQHRDLLVAQRPGVRTRTEISIGGTAYSNADLVQVLGEGAFGAELARHEIAHLFVHWAGGSFIPSWLDEGLAVWAESAPGGHLTGPLRRAIGTDELLLLRGLEIFPRRSDEEFRLAYGQSYSVVKYLLDSYGPDKMRQILESIKAGDGGSQAVQIVYGLTIDQLDAKWRESVGAKPRTYESVLPTPIVPDIVSLGTQPHSQPQPLITNAFPPYLPVIAALGIGVLGLAAGAAVFALVRRRI